MEQQNSAQVFDKNWNVYEKIMHLDYMHHSAFATRTAAVLQERNKTQSSLLDIGCGDAATIATVLANANIGFYKAYDLSPAALQLASGNISKLGFPFVLEEGNMLQLMQQEEKSFDIIYSSFAIHHLQDDEKKQMFDVCNRQLNDDGVFILIDVSRIKDYTRQEYLADYIALIKSKWQFVTAEEKQLIIDHVSVYDFPAQFDETIAWLQSSGFNILSSFQPDHLHAMIIAAKQ